MSLSNFFKILLHVCSSETCKRHQQINFKLSDYNYTGRAHIDLESKLIPLHTIKDFYHYTLIYLQPGNKLNCTTKKW